MGLRSGCGAPNVATRHRRSVGPAAARVRTHRNADVGASCLHPKAEGPRFAEARAAVSTREDGSRGDRPDTASGGHSVGSVNSAAGTASPTTPPRHRNQLRSSRFSSRHPPLVGRRASLPTFPTFFPEDVDSPGGRGVGRSVLCGAFVWGSNSSNATTGAGHSATEDKSSITLSTGDGDGDLLANFGKVVAL